MATGFHEVRLPEGISKGAVGGPGFKTTVLELASGKEQRNMEWAKARAEYDVAYGVKTQHELDVIRDFFYGRRGRAFGFRFKDWSDYKMPLGSIGQTDGTTNKFQVFKQYGDIFNYYRRDLAKLVDGTVHVLLDGIELQKGTTPDRIQIDINTGIITLGSALAVTTGKLLQVTCEFDVPVRFDVDQINATLEDYGVYTWGQIALKEIKP